MRRRFADGVRQELELEGWTFTEALHPQELIGQRDGEGIVVALCPNPASKQVEDAYSRLLARDSQGVRILALTEESFDTALRLPIAGRERLSIALRVYTKTGELKTAALEVIVSEEIPAGPPGWRNWRAHSTGLAATQRLENGLYSDSAFLGQLDGLGPFDVINTVSRNGPPSAGDAQQVLVLRHTWHLPNTSRLLGVKDPKTQAEGYYEGWVGDEFAAMLSLALHVRCADGGVIRTWFSKEELDDLGRPTSFWHHPPALDPPRYGQAILPGIGRGDVKLDDARELLALYPLLEQQAAVALVRASRQFQQAIWIADDAPGLAWLLLVGALETAAASIVEKEDASDLLQEMQPTWAEALKTSTSSDLDQVIRQMVRLSKPTWKVLKLIETYPPPEPPGRPGEPFRIEWPNIVSLVKKVYELRSDAVHEGRPFPAPLLDPPLPAVHPPPEAPGTTVGSGESVWTPADMPMYLHIFAGVVGSVLRSWWRSLATAS